MELKQFTTFLYIITFIVFFLMLVKQSKKSKTQHPKSLLPPGPSILPFIGNLLHLLGGLPHSSLKDLAKIHGPLMYLKLGEISAVVISSPGMAKQMMKTHDLLFLDRPSTLAAMILTYGYKDIIMAPYGEYWRQLRKVCILELLSAKRVQSFWSIREEEVSDLIRRISVKAGSPINLSQNIFSLTSDIISRVAFGKTFKDKEEFISLLKEQTKLGSGFSIHDLFPSIKFLEVIGGIKPKLEKISQNIDMMLEDIIQEHKNCQRENKESNNGKSLEEDLVDVLLRVQKDGELEVPITLENVKAVLVDIFIAGTDTSSTTLEWTLSELIRNPRVMEKAQAEVRRVFRGKKMVDQSDVNKLTYLRFVIKEALRLHPATPLLIPRECRDRCELGGYEIPKGTRVIVNAWAIGRDPEHWRDPESFEPERFQEEDIDYKGTNFKYIPFGAGRRICPGILFGIANIELPLAQLLYHFDWTPVNGIKPEELDMTEELGVAVRRKNDLYVIPTAFLP